MTGTWKTKGVSAKRLRYGRISSNLPLLFLALIFFLLFSCLVHPLCPYSPLLMTFPLIVLCANSAALSCFCFRPNSLNRSYNVKESLQSEAASATPVLPGGHLIFWCEHRARYV